MLQQRESTNFRSLSDGRSTTNASSSCCRRQTACRRAGSAGEEGQQNVQGQTSHRRCRVELLRDRNKGRTSRIEDLDDLDKIGKRAGQPVDLVDDDGIDPTRRDVGEQPLQSGAIDRRAGEPAVIISLGQAYPSLVALAGDEGLAGLALRLQRRTTARCVALTNAGSSAAVSKW